VRRVARGCAALAAVGLLALPAAATANVLDIPAAVPLRFQAALRKQMHMPPPRNGFESRVDLQAKHGYEISLIGVGNVVALEIRRRVRHPTFLERLLHLDRAATAYVVRGTVTPRRIKASFGELGAVDIRFRPSGKLKQSHRRRHCRGPDRFTTQMGVFVGSIRFSGERHYVAVRAHRAKGRVRSPLGLRCASSRFRPLNGSRQRRVDQHPSFSPTVLLAGWRRPAASTELFVLRGGGLTLYLAIAERNTGRMARIRYGQTTAPSKTFSLNEAATAATIKPPPPFHGKAIYRAAPDGTTSWGGSLTIAAPGAPRLPLTGEQFVVELDAGF
jgi:hypothetical protein